MTSPPSPPSPPAPTSPLHRALRAAKPPRRRTRRPHSSPSKPSASTAAISGSPPPPPATVSSSRPPSFFKSPKDLGTRLLNNIRSSSPDKPRHRRDDLYQTLLTFPEHDAATVAALFHRYDGDQRLVQDTLRQFRHQVPSPTVPRPPNPTATAPTSIPQPPSSGDPPSDPNVTAPPLSPSSPRDASSPPSMRSLHMSASVAATAPTERAAVFGGPSATLFDRPSQALAADVGGSAKPVMVSPRAWSTPGRRDDGAWEPDVGRAGVPPLSLGRRVGGGRRESVGRKRGDARRLYATSMGSMSVGSDMASLDSFGGGGRVSGMKRGRSSLGGSEVEEEVRAAGGGVMSPGSWGSGEVRGGRVPLGKDKGGAGVGMVTGFRRSRAGFETGEGEEGYGAVEPRDEEQGFAHGGGMGRRAREVRTTRNGRLGEGMVTELEAYRMLLRKVERMEGELREFRRHSEEMRRELEHRVEHSQTEQKALEQRHEAMVVELEENHRRGVTTERYLDLMRRELVQAVGRRRWRVVEILRSTVNNGVYYVLAYLVPVFAFLIRGVRDGVGWVRRGGREARGGGSQVGRLR